MVKGNVWRIQLRVVSTSAPSSEGMNVSALKRCLGQLELLEIQRDWSTAWGHSKPLQDFSEVLWGGSCSFGLLCLLRPCFLEPEIKFSLIFYMTQNSRSYNHLGFSRLYWRSQAELSGDLHLTKLQPLPFLDSSHVNSLVALSFQLSPTFQKLSNTCRDFHSQSR